MIYMESIKRTDASYYKLEGSDVALELYHKLLAVPEKPKEREDESWNRLQIM